MWRWSLAGVFGVTNVAPASPPPWSSSRHVRNDDYDDAPVTRVEPIVRQVRIETPRRECYDDVRYVESPAPQVAGHTLLGGIIGGVIGHQIGHGNGRDFATVAGAAIGAGVGYSNATRQYGSQTREETVQAPRRCAIRA